MFLIRYRHVVAHLHLYSKPTLFSILHFFYKMQNSTFRSGLTVRRIGGVATFCIPEPQALRLLGMRR